MLLLLACKHAPALPVTRTKSLRPSAPNVHKVALQFPPSRLSVQITDAEKTPMGKIWRIQKERFVTAMQDIQTIRSECAQSCTSISPKPFIGADN
jgi:hypothetical protein